MDVTLSHLMHMGMGREWSSHACFLEHDLPCGLKPRRYQHWCLVPSRVLSGSKTNRAGAGAAQQGSDLLWGPALNLCRCRAPPKIQQRDPTSKPAVFYLPTSRAFPFLVQPPLDTMRNTLIFAGSSCPVLTSKICESLGMPPAEAELSQFSNVGASRPCARRPV